MFSELFVQNPALGKLFDQVNHANSKDNNPRILESYHGFEGVSVLVDVGGGYGASLKAIIARYPHIKGINFDLPQVIAECPALPDDMELPIPPADGGEENLAVSNTPMAIDDTEATEMQIDVAASYVPIEPMQAGEELREEPVNRGGRKMTAKEEDEARWAVAKMFFEHRSLIENQLQSYNKFLETGMQRMFKEGDFKTN
ncbi:hypothetical protein M758_UG252700 [Ceratodon purpureus]|nr:hypothetical protein M758_UG252700 [Ceratodon purpureus]